MLEIKKISDENLIKQIAIENKIDKTNDLIFVAAFTAQKLNEFLCYTVLDDALSIYNVSDISNDFQIILGLIKTVIFYADIAQKEKVYLPLKYERIAKAIGFKQNGNIYELILSEYSKKCC